MQACVYEISHSLSLLCSYSHDAHLLVMNNKQARILFTEIAVLLFHQFTSLFLYLWAFNCLLFFIIIKIAK